LGFDQYAGNDPYFNGIDTVIPYGSQFFPEPVTPRIIHHITGNTMIKMEYQYSRHRYPGLVNQNNQDKPCKWDWMKVSQPTIVAKNRRSVEQRQMEAQLELAEQVKKPEGCNRGFVLEGNPVEIAEENEQDGKVHSSSDFELGYDHVYKSEQLVGIRFGLNIPPGVKITSGKISFKTKQASSNPVFMKILIEVTSDSVNFEEKKISDRIVEKKVLWTIRDSWAKGISVSTPDLSSLIQSIIDRPDWQPGNIVTFIIGGVNSNSPNTRTLESSTDTIQLVVDFCST